MTAISPTPKPGGKAAAGDDGKGRERGERPLSVSRAMRRPDENEREQDRGDAVVEQALGFDEQAQAPGHARIPAAAR